MKYYKGIASLKLYLSNGLVNKNTIILLNKVSAKKYPIEIYGNILYIFINNKEYSYCYNDKLNLYQGISSENIDEICKIIKLESNDELQRLYKDKNDVILKASIVDELGKIDLYDVRKDNSLENIIDFFDSKKLKKIFNFNDKKCYVNVLVNNKNVIGKIL